MVWRIDGPQGFESRKVRFDVIPFMRGDILDLGCGTEKIFPIATGVDNFKDSRLFGTPMAPDVKDDCATLPRFAEGSADVIFSSHLLEHVEDHRAALLRWWQVLREGGTLILYLPHADWYPNIGMPGANPDHVHDFRNEDIASAMRWVAWRTGRGWDLLRDEVRSDADEYSFLQVYRKRAGAGTFRSVPVRPEKSLALIRLGALGDALWVSSLLPKLKEEGWHITLYTQPNGEKALRHDPNIDEMVVQPDGLFGDGIQANALQGAYWMWTEKKHDRLINLVGSVERQLLPNTEHPRFYFPKDQRHRLMNRNYIEELHNWAGVPFDRKRSRVKFYPTPKEEGWALAYMANEIGDRPMVLLSPSGSSAPKWWPYTQKLIDILDEQGTAVVVAGDLRGRTFDPRRYGRILGTSTDIRNVFILARLADVVVGTESAIINSVSHEKCLKVALLSHSTHENLTRDWTNTIALEAHNLPCSPCHRIHMAVGNQGPWVHCTYNPSLDAAACQSTFTAEEVAEHCRKWIAGEYQAAKEAAANEEAA